MTIPGTIQVQGAKQEVRLQSGTMEAQKQAKLEDSAHQFEAMLLNEMLKGSKFGETEGSDEGADQTGGGQGDMIRGFATEAMTKAIANGGGFGLAKQIISQVTAEHTRQEAKKVGTKVW